MATRRALSPGQFEPDAYPRRINLGCGTDAREGYLNIDINAFNMPDLVADVRALDFLPGGYYEEVLAQDVLEHLPRMHTLQALRQWNRLLRMGGVLRLRVPDVLAVADMLRDPGQQEPSQQEALIQLLFGTQAYEGDFHCTSFTAVLLRHYLARAGFEAGEIGTMDKWLFAVAAPKVREVELHAGCDVGALLAIAGDEAFVQACYRELLRREPDPQGYAFYLCGLHQGGLSRRAAIDCMISSPEYLALPEREG